MKKAFLVLGAALSLAACSKDVVPPKDASLEGDIVLMPMGINESGYSKLFVLNEGGMGSNNSTLDFMRLKESWYITDAFGKMNPGIAAGLGDVGNDIAVHGRELWIVVNNSGIVEVISAADETEIAAIQVPTPRNIAFDSQYAYVTSWAGAHANGSYDKDGNYVITDSSNPKGQVYRIDLNTKKVDGSVEVGYQPEGIAYYDGKLYVANSGGISSQLPPMYSYDNTVSIIDVNTFKVIGSTEVAPNLKSIYADGNGAIFVTTFGNYWDVHTGLYVFLASNPSNVTLVGTGTAIKPEALHVSCSCISDGTVYCIGTEDEYDWSAVHNYSAWSCCIEDYATGKCTVSLYPQTIQGTPYGMTVIRNGSTSSPLHYLILGDAGDYFNPGTVSCYALDFNDGEKYWTVTAGVCPGHFALW